MIIDASVAFKWIVEEPGSEAAIAWFGRAELIAPTLVHAEVGNALWKRVRRHELADDGEITERLSNLASYVRTIDETPFIPRALTIAIELRHPVYDCVYLSMAEELGDELLTADGRFLRAVEATHYAPRVRELGA